MPHTSRTGMCTRVSTVSLYVAWWRNSHCDRVWVTAVSASALSVLNHWKSHMEYIHKTENVKYLRGDPAMSLFQLYHGKATPHVSFERIDDTFCKWCHAVLGSFTISHWKHWENLRFYQWKGAPYWCAHCVLLPYGTGWVVDFADRDICAIDYSCRTSFLAM